VAPDAGDGGAPAELGDSGTTGDAGACRCDTHVTSLECFCAAVRPCPSLTVALDGSVPGYSSSEAQLREYGECHRIDFIYRVGFGPLDSHFVYDSDSGALVGARAADDGAVNCGGGLGWDPLTAGALVDSGCVMTACRLSRPQPDGGTACP
jgi:hypothetical protein